MHYRYGQLVHTACAFDPSDGIHCSKLGCTVHSPLTDNYYSTTNSNAISLFIPRHECFCFFTYDNKPGPEKNNSQSGISPIICYCDMTGCSFAQVHQSKKLTAKTKVCGLIFSDGLVSKGATGSHGGCNWTPLMLCQPLFSNIVWFSKKYYLT